MKEQIKDIIINNANEAYPLSDIAAAEILALFSVSEPFTIITSCGETLKKCNNCGEIRNILDW